MTICDGCGTEVMRSMFHEGKWYCKQCQPALSIIRGVSGSMFPYVTTNIGPDPSKPIVVKSLRHLRQLESKFGVASVAFNQDSNHFADPPRGREQPR
jgi:hypothetical protein